jgi:hypothetical protein
MPITVSGTQITFNDATTQTTAAVAGTAIPSGTVMLFGQTSAPTGFTKLTNQDNAALRVVSGTASTGGSVDFSTAFASQTPSISITGISGSAGNTTLSTPQIPSHSHSFTVHGYSGPTRARSGNAAYLEGTATTNNTGGGGAHNHPFSFSSGTATSSAINLAVKFVDVIRATKD